MKSYACFLIGFSLLFATGCSRKNNDHPVVSQKYIHKYGYAVSQQEFEEQGYPGQVITVLKNGITTTSSYEDGELHGPCTETYPNSQTLHSYSLYKHGDLVKQVLYDLSGMPLSEEIQLSDTRYSRTFWYAGGTPRSIEEYVGKELLEGQYFTTKNELESQVFKGEGKRIKRDAQGVLLSKEEIKGGFTTFKESFYPNGSPETIAHFLKGELHGEKKTFSPTGEPLAVVHYVNGVPEGLATFFKNGTREKELYYINGMKNGVERHYVDGEIVSAEIFWTNDQRHGPSTYYTEELAQVDYYYEGKPISKGRWEEYNRMDEMIAHMNDVD